MCMRARNRCVYVYIRMGMYFFYTLCICTIYFYIICYLYANINSTRNIKKLQSFEMWAYRKMMKISWRDKKRNEEVLKLADERLYIVP